MVYAEVVVVVGRRGRLSIYKPKQEPSALYEYPASVDTFVMDGSLVSEKVRGCGSDQMRGMRKAWFGIDVRHARSNQVGVVTYFRAWI